VTKVGWFSTDFQFEAAPAPGQPGRKKVTYGGTYHYRMAVPAGGLETYGSGWECVLSPAVRPAPDGHLMVMGTDQRWHDDCDVVVFQRWMHEAGADMARRARAAGQVIVQDVDDQFWALPTTNIARKTTDPSSRKDFNRDHYRRMIAASSAVICSTASIAGSLSRLGPPVSVCRNAIDIDRWHVRDPGQDGMVGWVGGIAWRGNDLPLLKGVLGPFLDRYGLPFYHGGHDPNPQVGKAWDQLGLDPARVAHMPIVDIGRYPELWAPINLAVIPLEDSTFNRGKSWLKGLEAAACGLPFIASKLPEYERLGCGRLAKTGSQWTAHLEALVDPEVRRVEGAANRRRAEELSIARQWQQWDTVLRDLVREPVAA
jgi:glycosyltransferase involved in cell wall biosynthesis